MMKKIYSTIGLLLFGMATYAQGPQMAELSEKKMLPSPERYNIKKTAFSSERHEDFGAYSNNGKLYFLSDRNQWAIQFRDENKRSFLDLYEADENGDVSKSRFSKSRANKRLNEGPICFSKDGKRVYYTRDYSYGKKMRGQDGKIHLGLYTARIEDGKWLDEMPLSVNNQDYSVGHPTLSNDGKYLYYVSNQPGGKGGTDIYRATVAKDGNVSASELEKGEINTSGNELFPFIGPNDELFFSSTEHNSVGGLDVFIATETSNGYGSVMNVGAPVNSVKDDFAYTVSNDTKGYFSSNRDGSDDVYGYDLLVPFSFNPTLNGQIAMDDGTSSEGVKVELIDANGNVVDSKVTDADGNYSFDLEDGKEYTVRYFKDEYLPKEVAISTNGNGDGNNIDLAQDVSLEKDNGIGVYLLITESGTAVPVEGVTVEMKDLNKGENFMSQSTGSDGMVRKNMKNIDAGDEMHLDIKLSKEGYLTKEVVFKHTLEDRDDLALHKFLQDELKMDKVDFGKDVGQMIDVKPIYFDLGKFDIRSDAAHELDKIVLVLQNNPTIEIELGSHTDARGSASSNLRLSDKRAKASRDYIVSKGIAASRVSGKGYGENKLKNQCKDGVNCSENEHQQNRRTEFLITKL